MEKPKVTKETLSKVFTSLIDSFEMGHIKENPALFEYLKSATIMDDLSAVELMVLWPVRELISSALKIKYETDNSFGIDAVVNWSFYESHLEKLINSKEGFGCVCDKASYILRQYINHKFTGKEPEFSETREHYWEPKFGVISEWMTFVDSLCRLRYGDPKEYLTAYKALLDASKERMT